MSTQMRADLRVTAAWVLVTAAASPVPVALFGRWGWPGSFAVAAAGSWVVVRRLLHGYVEPTSALREALHPHELDRTATTADVLTLAAGAYRDTARELVRAARREASREVALAHASDGVLVLDHGHRVEYANPAARALLHERAIEANQRVLSPEVVRLAERARTGGGVVTEEVVIHLPAPAPVLVRAVPLADGGTVLLLADLSETHRVDRVRRDFVTNVSHELKTPAAGIRALAEVAFTALESGDTRSAGGFMERLQLEAERLSKLVGDLLDLSRVETSGALELRDVGLKELAVEAVERARGVAELKGLTIDVAGPPLVTRGDAAQLAMAVQNLVDNAVRYSERGVVMVAVEKRPEGRAAVVVADQGIGIPSEEVPRIFERFYRVDKARSRVTGGTGLGLAIVRHVAENHGGRVEVTSELGRGSTFTLLLPVARSLHEVVA